MTETRDLLQLAEELYALRRTVRALRRRVEDILYNLDEENMPNVSARLSALSSGLSKLLTADAEPSINAAAIAAALNAAGVALSIDAATAPTLYKDATAKTDALRLLAVDKNGKLYAVI